MTTNSQAPDLSQHRVLVIVPAYNEERFIGSVILKIKQHPVDVLVIDDGSTDLTCQIARAAGAEVYCEPTNQGKGAALNIGFQLARQRRPDAVAVIDADGQHLPEELPRLLAPILLDQADIVIGSRYIDRHLQHPHPAPLRSQADQPGHQRALRHLCQRLAKRLPGLLAPRRSS
jgi:glycosyltransferase involved in cell wall biosynthesis